MKGYAKWILWGIPVLFAVGSLLHFAYDASGGNPVVGVFAPVNESVWEHLKLAFWPMTAWWFAYFGLLGGGKRHGMDADRWVTPAVAAILTGPLFITAFYYTYHGALGIESLFLDILSLLLAIAVGQLLGLHLLERGRFGRTATVVSMVAWMAMALAFAVFTFDPPKLPIFEDD